MEGFYIGFGTIGAMTALIVFYWFWIDGGRMVP